METIRYRYACDKADIWNGMLVSCDEDYLKLIRQQMDERGIALMNLCCVGCHIWGDTQEARDRQEQLAFVTAGYKRYCALAAKYGARLGPENHWGATTNANEMRRLFAGVRAENFAMLLHVGNWTNTPDVKGSVTDESRLRYNVEFAPLAMHMHVMFEVCEQAGSQLLPLAQAGYGGAWSIESHRGTNEYNNVAYQLACVRRVLMPCEYAGWGRKN